MHRVLKFVATLGIFASACGSNTEPASLDATWDLAEENGQPLPSDPSAPDGCCLTLAGTLVIAGSTYDLRTMHRNKVNGSTFENSEQGTFMRQGSTLTFSRTGGGGEGFPYLLAPGALSNDDQTLTILYGDEGPGSDQTEAVFHR